MEWETWNLSRITGMGENGEKLMKLDGNVVLVMLDLF